VESAGIPDLADDCDLARAVRQSTDRVDSGGIHAESKSVLMDVVMLSEILADRSKVERTISASHNLEFRIDEFTNHDDLLQRVECVNNIWLEASQRLTARVDA
jgi:hypothetical protein